jgi:FkbH-like protein
MSKSKKCIVWDLDNTLWDGICIEGDVKPRPEIQRVISELDQHGIIHSIASRNEEEVAMKVLENHKLAHFFVVPQINWLPKTTNIVNITEALNISLDSVAFVDDDPFELDQVSFMLPDVMTIPANEASQLSHMQAFNPGYTTEESRSRRQFYQAEEKRKETEQQFASREEFLMSCNMKLSIRTMRKKDIPRVLELMTRTHQLNTTGQIFPEERLLEIMNQNNENEVIFIAELRDKFGWNGIIGTAVIEFTQVYFRILFFAMSCRILGRGIERAFLASLVKEAIKNDYNEIEALYKNTGRNSMMRALYQMSGFKHRNNLPDKTMIFFINHNQIPDIPKWVEVL